MDFDTKCLGLWLTESVHRRLVQSVSPNRGQDGSPAMCLCQCRVVPFRLQREVTTTHPLHQRGCDPFHIAHGFIRRHGEMQVSPLNRIESAQIAPKRRARPMHRYGRALHVGPLCRHCLHTRARCGGRWHGTDDSLNNAPLSGREPHAAHTRCSPSRVKSHG